MCVCAVPYLCSEMSFFHYFHLLFINIYNSHGNNNALKNCSNLYDIWSMQFYFTVLSFIPGWFRRKARCWIAINFECMNDNQIWFRWCGRQYSTEGWSNYKRKIVNEGACVCIWVKSVNTADSHLNRFTIFIWLIW